MMKAYIAGEEVKPETLFERFEIYKEKKYGEGGYGATYAARDKQNGEHLAVKLIDMRRMRPENVLKECNILQTLTHPNIIAVKGHGPGLGNMAHVYFIYMEVASGGELFDQVIDRGANAMDEPTARTFFCQLLDGIAYCHLAGVAHRDLKLENVLLNSTGVVKVIDFGLSHVYPRDASGQVDRSKRLHDVCGSKSYAAPEVLANTPHGYDGYAADLWSLGVCLFAMLAGFFPLDEATANDWRFPRLAEAQKRAGGRGASTTKTVYGWYKRPTSHLSREVVHLLDSLLTIDPAKRLTVDQVREHPWVTNTKFGMGGAADQGTFNASQEVSGFDGPTYRGLGNVDPNAFEGEAFMEDDEMPVYRSMGMADADEAPALATPAIARQKARINFFEPEADDLAALI